VESLRKDREEKLVNRKEQCKLVKNKITRICKFTYGGFGSISGAGIMALLALSLWPSFVSWMPDKVIASSDKVVPENVYTTTSINIAFCQRV
jgi:hypothetical protein